MKNSIYNMIRKTGLAAGIILLLFACEKDVTVKLKPHTPSLVVHGYIAVGDTFVIAVGKTTNVSVVSGDADTYVKNATVILYEDGVIKDTLTYNELDFRYTSALEAVLGKTYKVVVQALGFTTVEATAQAPSLVPTTIVSYIKNARLDMDGQSLNDVKFRIADPGTEKNYYLAELASTPSSFFCIYTNDPIIEQYQGGLNPFETTSCIGNKEVIFSDNLFNGTSRDIMLSADSYAMDDSNGDYPYLKKYNITKEFYNYIRDGISIDITEGNPFAEPNVVEGNIRNGYGLFTVYSFSVDTLR